MIHCQEPLAEPPDCVRSLVTPVLLARSLVRELTIKLGFNKPDWTGRLPAASDRAVGASAKSPMP